VQASLSGGVVTVDDPDALGYFVNRILVPLLRSLLGNVNRLSGTAIAKDTDATLDGSELFVLVDATAGPVSIELARPAAVFRPVVVQKKDASANAVTVVAPTGATINGAASSTLAAQWDRLILLADDTAYYG
jgi:hypothetical protein